MTTGRCVGDARLEHLEEVEGLKAEFLDRRRIGDAQENQGEQQDQAQCPRQSEPPSQLDSPLHVERTKPACLEVARPHSRNMRINWSRNGLVK